MVGVQDEQLVQHPGEHRVDGVPRRRYPERHPQEVLHVAQVVVRVQERLADRLLVRVRRDRRQLGDQPDRGDLHLLRVEQVEAVLVEGGQRADRRGQHRHRVRVAGEPVEEPAQVLMQQGVHVDQPDEVGQLLGGRQLAVDQQVGDLQERGVLGELLDRVPAVAQDPSIAVDVGDRGRARGRVDEPRIVGHVPALREQLADVQAGGTFDRRVYRQRKVAARVIKLDVRHLVPHSTGRYRNSVPYSDRSR